MMKKVIRKNNGITLVSVSVAVIIILILTPVIIYNVRDSLGISNLKAMQNDIQNLRDMVSNYYSINGKIPAKIKYTNTENIERIRNAGVISEKVDIGDLGVRELSQRTIGSIVNEINRSYRNTINNGGAAVCHECLSITRDAREIIGLDGVKFYCKDCIDSKDILSRCVVCGKRLREKGKLQEENRDNKLCMCKECYDRYYSPSKYEEESMVESIGMGEGRKIESMTEDEINKWIHYRPLRPEQIERLEKLKEVKGGKR